MENVARFLFKSVFFVYAAQFLICSLRQKHPLLDVNPVGSTFNIQNSIPHKSQKPKAVAEINRPIEFQRGTVGATESAKECDSVLPEGSDIGLGPRGLGFESRHSDQIRLKSVDFSRIFLSLWSFSHPRISACIPSRALRYPPEPPSCRPEKSRRAPFSRT